MTLSLTVDPSFCLFEHTEKGNYTLQFNPNSYINPEHLDYFQFVGRAVGLAIYHRRFLDAHFATSIYKLALGRPLGLEDMAMIDADMHQSLTWMVCVVPRLVLNAERKLADLAPRLPTAKTTLPTSSLRISSTRTNPLAPWKRWNSNPMVPTFP